MPFSKHGINIDLDEIKDKITNADRIKTYQKLVDEIRSRAFKGGVIDADHDFTKYY